jgi:muramoyltetrapeptide carboxypeptidase
VLTPPALHPGSKIHIIAPSGPFDRALFWRATGWLSKYHRLRFDRSIFERNGFLAGSDDRRRSELQQAIDNPEIGAIVAARGGWGAARFITSIDFSGLISHPKWIVGFSDPTVLHVRAWQLGVASLHAANFVGLGRGDEYARGAWLQALEIPDKARVLRGHSLSAGKRAGVLVGGNLSVLFGCLAMGILHFPDNCILALEDVAESSYRVDRMLNALLSSGVMDRVAAFALGQFVDCDSGRNGVPVGEVLKVQIGRIGVPAVINLPFGHGRVNEPLPLGAQVTLDGTLGELRLGLDGT